MNSNVRVPARKLSALLEGIRMNAVHPGWVQIEMGGPNALLALDEGTETLLLVIRDLSDSTYQFWQEQS